MNDNRKNHCHHNASSAGAIAGYILAEHMRKRKEEKEKAEAEAFRAGCKKILEQETSGQQEPKKPFTQADMRAWQIKNNRKP